MKTRGIVLAAVLGVACGGVAPESENTDSTDEAILVRPKTSTFYIKGLGDRCWDFGTGVARLAGCNNSASQTVAVSEIDAHHDVTIRVSTGCLTASATKGGVNVGSQIEVKPCTSPTSASQRFALDGDSILMGRQSDGADVERILAAVPKGQVTNSGTLLVLEERDVNDGEYFRFVATSGVEIFPHTGFVRVPAPGNTKSDDVQFQDAIDLGWGTVVVIGDERPLVLTTRHQPKSGGVTIRSSRKGGYQGSQIVGDTKETDGLIVIDQDYTRITGLRIQGPTASRDHSDIKGIRVYVPVAPVAKGEGVNHSVVLDHLEVSQWPAAAIDVIGPDDAADANGVPSQDCSGAPPKPRPALVRVVDNFIHHNEGDDLGYGVVVGHGANVFVRGNMMYLNRHAIASDGRRYTGYVAYDNFVLSDAPSYGTWDNLFEQDFDKHGTKDGSSWNGGIAGNFVDIGWNTFLGTNRRNFDERGEPCDQTLVHDNVFRQSSGDAITTQNPIPSKDVFTPNQFSAPDPTKDVAVADFDGDGHDDVFVGTGAAWYYASGGAGQWTRLNRQPEHASALRFGDLDGDGRADVIAVHGSNVDVSWAGISPWQTINVVGWATSDIAVGDFDGDRIADLFLATGSQWFVAKGGRNWALWNTQPQRTLDLRFGDFDHDGRTDVFGVNGNQWQMVGGGQGAWTLLRSALTTTTSGLFVADFDGDGYADVARSTGSAWQYAARGWGGFVNLRSTSTSLAGLPIGKFDDGPSADVLFWNDRHYWIAPSAKDPTAKYSRQDLQ